MQKSNFIFFAMATAIAIQAQSAFSAADYTADTFKGAWAWKLALQLKQYTSAVFYSIAAFT